LRRAAWQCEGPVFWSPDRTRRRYRRLTEDDRVRLREDFARHGRSALLPR
jgi:hypothetical protein